MPDLNDLSGLLGDVPVPQAQAAAVAVEGLEKAKEEVTNVGVWLLHNAALTADEGYEGWPAVLGLGYEAVNRYVIPPARFAWHIEQQIAGVLDQAYRFLGGSGSAIDAGIHSVEKALGAGWSALSRWF